MKFDFKNFAKKFRNLFVTIIFEFDFVKNKNKFFKQFVAITN